MIKKTTLILTAFCLSLPLCWGIVRSQQALEDSLYLAQIAQNPLPIALNKEIRASEATTPAEVVVIPGPEINAKAAFALFVAENGEEYVLFAKNEDAPLPLASLTKLTTAAVILENYDLSQMVTISKEAVNQKSELGNLKIGEEFSVRDLLNPLLMESSNDAAYAIAEVIGLEHFVDLMNLKATDLGLTNTVFLNPTGLDEIESTNVSTAKEITALTKYLFSKPLLWEILKTPRLNLYTPDKVYHHQVVSTNEFLETRPTAWQGQILGGKTGWTVKANGCLMLALEAPKGEGRIIAVVLGADDRFGEMEKMINWIHQAYFGVL